MIQASPAGRVVLPNFPRRNPSFVRSFAYHNSSSFFASILDWSPGWSVEVTLFTSAFGDRDYSYGLFDHDTAQTLLDSLSFAYPTGGLEGGETFNYNLRPFLFAIDGNPV